MCVCKLFIYSLFYTFRSGSGKSTVLKTLSKKLNDTTKLYLVNVRSKEAAEYRKLHANTVSVTQGILEAENNITKSTNGSLVFLEDIIKLSEKEEQTLRNWLNYRAHHHNLKIFCVAHTIVRTSLQSMLPLFNYIVLTSVLTNIPLLKQAANYFNLGKKTALHWAQQFRNCKKGQGHLIFIDCELLKLYHRCPKGTITFLAAADDEIDESVTLGNTKKSSSEKIINTYKSETSESNFNSLEKKFSTFFDGHPDKVTASAIFSIVIRVIPDSMLRTFDLTVAFKLRQRHQFNSQGDNETRISLVDYVDTLLDTHPIARAQLEFKVLHEFLKQKCNIPRLFIKNVEFRTSSTSPTKAALQSSLDFFQNPTRTNSNVYQPVKAIYSRGLTKIGPLTNEPDGCKLENQNAPNDSETNEASQQG